LKGLAFEEIITTLIKETEEDKDHGGKVLLKSQYESLFGVLVQIELVHFHIRIVHQQQPSTTSLCDGFFCFEGMK
jgi:hypothetical protein